MIIISLLGFIKIKLDLVNDYKSNSKIVRNIEINGVSNKSKYIGYIEIPEVQIKRAIVNEINNFNLNNNDIAMNKKENIILAGHSIENVFKNLHNIEIGMSIILNLYEDISNYTVTDKFVVLKDSREKYEDDLVLITCMFDPNKRLIILAKKTYN